jgi:hypothetical protein
MALNFHELLSLPQMNQLKPAAGKDGLDNVVHWVYVAECLDYQLQDFSWINGGELIFITGKSIGGNTDELMELVEELRRKKAAGLVINVGPYISSIPQQLIDVADESGFPLFELPWDAKLVNITQVICRKIISSELGIKSAARILEKLLFHANIDEAAVSADLENFGIDLKTETCVGMMKLRGDCRQLSPDADETDFALWYKKVSDLLSYSAYRQGPKFVSLFYNSSLVFLTRSAGEPEELQRILEEINSDPLLRKAGVEAIIGLGGAYSGALNQRKSFAEAGWALKIMEFEKKKAFFLFRTQAFMPCSSRCRIPAC